MRKILLSILLVVMLSVAVLSGCDLVQKDSIAFADGICAEVNGVTVTRRELVNYYIYARNNNASYTVEELLEEIIKVKLIVKDVKDNFADYVAAVQANETNTNAEQLGLEEGGVTDTTHYLKNIKNKHYYNEVVQNVIDALNNEILEYENVIRETRGDEALEAQNSSTSDDDTSDDSADSNKTTFDAEKLYENGFELKNGKIVKTNEPTEFEDVAVVVDFANYNYTSDGLLADKQEAYKRFINGLIRNEKGKNLDTVEANVLEREFERIYRIYEDEVLENMFQQRIITDEKLVVKKYQDLVKNSYSKIHTEGATDAQIRDAYVKLMEDKSSTTYYHPYTNTNQGYIQVAHILVKFTDEQIKGEDNENSLKNILQIEDAAEREAKLAVWEQSCYGKERYTLENENKDEEKYAGNEFGEDILYYSTDLSKTTIYSLLLDALAGKTTVAEKAEVLNDFAYKFGQDPGMINPTGYYAVSLDTSIYNDTNKESWEKAFADEARRLYNEEGAGALSGPIYVNQYINEDGTFNEDGGYAGYHFIFVVGEYDNVFNYETEIDTLTDDDKYMDNAIRLLNTRVMLGVEEKTLYDKVYDLLTYTDYSTAKENKVATLLSGKTIKFNKAYYSDLPDLG